MRAFLVIMILIASDAFAVSGPFFTRTQDSEQTPFDNSTNGFTAEDVQAAIEEARDTAPGKARATVQLISNGGVLDNEWVGYSELLPCNTTPIPVPWNSTIEEITYSFDRNSVDGNFELYKNGFDASDIVYTFNFSNAAGPVIDDTISLAFSAGDFLCGRWDDNGQNPRDLGVGIFFLID